VLQEENEVLSEHHEAKSLTNEERPARGTNGAAPDTSHGSESVSSLFHGTRCAHMFPNGSACLAHHLKDSPFCFYHDPRPDVVAKRLKAADKGTKRSKSRDGLPSWQPHKIGTLEELKNALSDLFNAGMAGDITTSRLSALASVANALSSTIRHSDLETRIGSLEKLIEGSEL
jgi:hypothetical protein